MTELERALLHIKTRADAWALKEVEKAIELDYKTAFQIACALLNGDTLYGMDAESIFSEIMKKDGCVCSLDYENYILTHLNELRDDKALSQECVGSTQKHVGNALDMRCDDAEQIDYHDDFATALKKINDYEMTRDERAAISILNAYKVGYESAMEDLEQEPCDDAISREAVDKYIARLLSGYLYDGERERLKIFSAYLWELPSVTQKSGKCKNCKYFEYDSVAKVDGIPLIVAHEICNKWGNGCKTSEDGYCYLFEPQESEDKE